MRLLIINTKVNNASRYYRLFKVDGENMTEIGFSGLGTDYTEIQDNKKTLKDGTFYYVSKKYRADGIPRDIIYKLKSMFDELTYINGIWNGLQATTITQTLKELCDEYHPAYSR